MSRRSGPARQRSTRSDPRAARRCGHTGADRRMGMNCLIVEQVGTTRRIRQPGDREPPHVIIVPWRHDERRISTLRSWDGDDHAFPRDRDRRVRGHFSVQARENAGLTLRARSRYARSISGQTRDRLHPGCSSGRTSCRRRSSPPSWPRSRSVGSTPRSPCIERPTPTSS